MNREQIIGLARRSGYFVSEAVNEKKDITTKIITGGVDHWSELVAFAELVVSAEREACIKACEEVTADLKNYASAFEGITAETKFIRNIGGIVGEPFIEAIKARGQE